MVVQVMTFFQVEQVQIRLSAAQAMTH